MARRSDFDRWLVGNLHHRVTSPATIAQVVAAVKWTASKSRIDVVGEITQRTLAGIRREGKARGRGQVEGIVWSEVDRVCAFAESGQFHRGAEGRRVDSAHERLSLTCQ